MSREINLEEKLSPEDHEYFRGRWDVISLRRNALAMGVDQGDADRAAFWSYDEYEQKLSDAENAPEPAGDQTPDPNAGTGSTPIPASAGAQQATGLGLGAQRNDPTPATVNDEGKVEPRAFADPELAGRPYDKWNNDQLRAEITKRNELRADSPDYADEEPMSTDGNKSDLADRLSEDDEADAPADGNNE